jgi:hypothetical protein
MCVVCLCVCVCVVWCVCVCVCAEFARIVWMLQRRRIINVRVRRTASVCFVSCDFVASVMNEYRGLAEWYRQGRRRALQNSTIFARGGRKTSLVIGVWWSGVLVLCGVLKTTLKTASDPVPWLCDLWYNAQCTQLRILNVSDHGQNLGQCLEVSALRLIHTHHTVPLPCRAAPLPCPDSAVSFMKVRVVAGKIRTASPTVQRILFLILLLPFLAASSLYTCEEQVIIACGHYQES